MNIFPPKDNIDIIVFAFLYSSFTALIVIILKIYNKEKIISMMSNIYAGFHTDNAKGIVVGYLYWFFEGVIFGVIFSFIN